MSTERLKLLHQFYDEDPADPFNSYALALEYLNVDPEKALEFFEILLHKHVEYLPTYYHAAKFFQERGQKERAIHVYERGMALAGSQGNSKALRELRSAYDEFMFE